MQGVILNFGGNRRRCRHGSGFDLARYVASSRNGNNGGLHSSDSPTRLTLASPRLSVAMADQWLLRLSRKETNTLHSLIPPPTLPTPAPRLPLCPHMCEIKAIMTLHLTEDAISPAKRFHLVKYERGHGGVSGVTATTRCPTCTRRPRRLTETAARLACV